MGGGRPAGFSVTDFDVLASTYGVVGDGTTDDTAAIQAMLTAGAGKKTLFDVPGVFKTGNLLPPSNTDLIFVSGVTLEKKLNGIRVMTIGDRENVRIRWNNTIVHGADLEGTTAYSHTVAINGSKNVTFEDVNIMSASAGTAPGRGKDGLYIGPGTGYAPCENVTILRGKVHNALRNGISVTAAMNTVLRGIDVAYASGAPGAGIDIEANVYETIDGTLIEDCHVHHNGGAGVLQVFGINTKIKGGSIHDNGTYGAGCASGGTQFDEEVFRPNVDVIGVTGSESESGVIMVGDRSGLPVGMVVNFQLNNGATAPAELGTGYLIVSRHVGTDGVVLGEAVDGGEITSFATGFTGTMDADPYLSDIRLRAFTAGQSDGFEIDGVKIYNNGTQGAFLGGAGNHYVHGCEIYDNGGNQVQAQYTRNTRITDNEIYQTAATSNNNSGISFSTGSGTMDISGNNIYDIRGKGINGASWTGASIDANTVSNCAKHEASSGKAGINLESIKGFSVTNNRVMQAGDNADTVYGVRATATAVDGVVTDNDCTGAGTTNANSILISSGTTTAARNKRRDGMMA